MFSQLKTIGGAERVKGVEEEERKGAGGAGRAATIHGGIDKTEEHYRVIRNSDLRAQQAGVLDLEQRAAEAVAGEERLDFFDRGSNGQLGDLDEKETNSLELEGVREQGETFRGTIEAAVGYQQRLEFETVI